MLTVRLAEAGQQLMQVPMISIRSGRLNGVSVATPIRHKANASETEDHHGPCGGLEGRRLSMGRRRTQQRTQLNLLGGGSVKGFDLSMQTAVTEASTYAHRPGSRASGAWSIGDAKTARPRCCVGPVDHDGAALGRLFFWFDGA